MPEKLVLPRFDAFVTIFIFWSLRIRNTLHKKQTEKEKGWLDLFCGFYKFGFVSVISPGDTTSGLVYQ